jgi:(+)-neomenthol dehydrogenase
MTAKTYRDWHANVPLLQKSGLPDVIFHQMDVADRSSITRPAEFVRTKFGKLDISLHDNIIWKNFSFKLCLNKT